ncbi:MAG: hypothetical protein WC444_00190 [Candidatus Paceibacterota bacterium]
MKSTIVILLSLGYSSYLVHKGAYGFGKWSKDARNGFHWGIAFAAVTVLVVFLFFLSE